MKSLRWISLRLSCDMRPPTLRFETKLDCEDIWVDEITGDAAKTASGVCGISAGTSAIFIQVEGASLVRSDVGLPITVLPTNSALFSQGPAKLVVQAAKGKHRVICLCWKTASFPALETWYQAGPCAKGSKHLTASRSLGHDMRPCLQRLLTPKDLGGSALPHLMACIGEMSAYLTDATESFVLAKLPNDLPKTIQTLTDDVRSAPEKSWPLSEAAEVAGYSPFHFSRIFKQLAGFGFHEFVDRCRTQTAVSLLCDTDLPIDTVALQSGFGTAQGLRESVKEYLGMVPSDLRGVPDGASAFLI